MMRQFSVSTLYRISLGMFFIVALAFAFNGVVGAQTGGGAVLVGRLDGAIDPLSARTLRGWLEDAAERDAALFVLELDTPGGSADAMRDMTGAILESSVPVAAIVTPAGARAASAGTFIVSAAHVSAMAPGTTIGAASPVDSGARDLGETIKEKVSQDVAALIRGIASQRGRSPDAAAALEATIFEAKSYSAEEAVDAGIVDLMARDVPDLLSKIEGMVVNVRGTDVAISAASANPQTVTETPVQRARGWLANPTLVFLLLAVGGILILVEVVSPGGWVAGVSGATLIALAIIGLVSLPVNWIGLILIAAGLGLIFWEVQAPGWGGFGAAGGIAILAGGFFLFGDTSQPGLPAPDPRVGYAALAGVGAFLALSVFGLFYFSRKARAISERPRRDAEIVGQVGEVRTALDPTGTVQVASELWTAESETGETIESGESVVVAEVDGLTLKVFKESSLEALERGLR